MTPEERAEDILRRCWWSPIEHPGEEHPGFKGLDKEITNAIRAAIAEEREACAKVAEGIPVQRRLGRILAAMIAAQIRARGRGMNFQSAWTYLGLAVLYLGTVGIVVLQMNRPADWPTKRLAAFFFLVDVPILLLSLAFAAWCLTT